ncbi:MAG TPA: peptidylprolyl isomerase [Roseiflexaceae bacterium]|nr:peptidylprolyl isomerase [Roseiflexaceae bacterium]
MAQTPNKSQPAGERPQTKRASRRRQREQRRQRLVMIIAGSAIGLALLAVLIGLSYERLWIPSRPIARAGSATLSRGDYWNERRYEIARRLSQSLQLLSLFGSQFSSQFEGQIPQLDTQIPTIRTDPVDEETVNGWIDRQVILQSAAQEFQIQANDGEVAQMLVGDLGRTFGPPPPPPTSTTSLTPTTVLSATAAATAEATDTTSAAAPTAAGATAAPGGPTATPAATETTAPTEVPTATPLADAALKQQDEIVGRLFDAYQQELLRLNPGARANLALNDFKAALRDQYLRQAVTTKVEQQLIPEASFTPTSDPSSIETRQILISVTATLSDTQEQRDAAYAARKPAAEAILARLRGGEDFATVAKEVSEDYATREQGGTLASFDKDGKTQQGQQMDPAIVKAVLALDENAISDLIQTPFGWHIIQVVKKTVDSKENQLQAARTKKFDEWLAQKRAAFDISRVPPQTPSPTAPPTGTPAALPTVQLASTPTATLIPTTTTTLSDTTALTATPAPLAAPTAQSAPAAPTPTQGTAAPTAVLPTATPKP